MFAVGRVMPHIDRWGTSNSDVRTFGSRAMVAVKYDDLSMALDFISSASLMEHNAYVSLDTGEVYCTSDSIDAFDEEVPDDLESSDRYLAIPHKSDLISEEGSPCALSLKSCLRVTTRSKDFSNGKALTRASRICCSTKAFSKPGLRLKPTLSKAH